MNEDWEVDTDENGTATSGLCKKFLFTSDLYRHLLIERDELEVPSSLNGLLEWLIAGDHTGAPLFATKWGDIDTLGITTFRTHIGLLKQQQKAGEENLKARKFDLLG